LTPQERATYPGGIEFVLVPSRILRLLLLFIAVLVVLSTVGQVIVYSLPDFPLRDGIANLFYVDREQSLPNMFSTMMLGLPGMWRVICRASSRAQTS
jgi:hypothetical protein